MNTNLIQEVRKTAMRKPVHTKYTIKDPDFTISNLEITNAIVEYFKKSAVEYPELYTEEYVKQKVSQLISNRIKFLYANDIDFPNMAPIEDIKEARADFIIDRHYRSINVGCVLKTKDNENWLFLFPMYVGNDMYSSKDAIYKKIETKYFDLKKFPLSQINKKRLASQTADELLKRNLSDYVVADTDEDKAAASAIAGLF